MPWTEDGASHHVKVKSLFQLFQHVVRRDCGLALMAWRPYLSDMQRSVFFAQLSLALRGLLVVALLAIAPLYEKAHAMDAPMGMGEAMVHISSHDMSVDMRSSAMTGQMPASHGHFDAGCRILCYGWVENAHLVRPEGQSSEIAVTLAPAHSEMRDGIMPPPIRHPPKPASFA